MEKRFLFTLALAMSVALLGASVSLAALGIPGEHQDALLGEDTLAGDWSAPAAPTMTETPASSGIYQHSFAGLEGPGRYQFKVLDDEGTPPFDFNVDPQLTPKNSWFLADATGAATVAIDTNTYTDGYLPDTNRVSSSTDATEVTGFFATGDWMVEAGGAANWVNNDLTFLMSDQGSGLYSKVVTVTTPGPYQWKATKGDWDGQWGTDGRNIDATTWQFTTVEANQDVTFLLDISKGAISLATSTFEPGDTDNDMIVELTDLDPIRANFLTNTFVRADGDLTGDGIVDVADFREWKDAYLAAQVVGAATVVPEPSSLALIVFACLGVFAPRRRVVA